MKNRNCYLFVFDGYADWEPALAIAMMNKHTDFAMYTFSVDGNAKQSMGNLSVKPTTSLKDIRTNEIDLLMLPGGDIWESGGNEEVAPLVKEMISKNKTVAAICGATVLLARHGHLDRVNHTSNGLEYLKKISPSYKGAKYYLNQPSVTDGNIITANGAAMIDFAIAIFRKIELADKDTIEKIDDLYKSSGMNNRFS
jgi:putative intracellular protease/amidase